MSKYIFATTSFDYDWKYNFLLNVLTQACPDCRNWKDKFQINIEPGIPIELDLKILINGIEVDYNSFFQMMEDSFHSRILDKAKELVADKFIKLSNSLLELQEKVESEIESI